ncbi:hypothetical protein COW53_06940 [bacterium CG17_big_fil_post_rev_8_21_14_2_50_64_8]|nr:MAG: hypothetical protein COW53_06940 [bacterium CG17_big_fil_post_rev_8_21_14_2_50_64_8]
MTWQETKISVHAGVFGSWFSDYILPQIIDRIDVNGDDLPDAIKGFLPVDARLYGGELGLEWRPRGWVRIPVSVAVVRGENTTDGRDLPEIPPVSGSAELRLRAHAATGSWFAARCDFAADQKRIDPLFGENATPGYAVWSVALATRPVAGLDVDLRVGNIFDCEYHDHLTRESALTAGDLLKGQEIPAVGRNIQISARMEF